MAAPISLVPQVQDLKLYCGDGVDLQISVSNGGAGAVDLSGEITAQIRASRLDSTVVAEFAADQTDAVDGIVIVSLTGDQTAALHENDLGNLVETFKGVWDVQWVPTDSEPITLLQGSVESSLDVTRLP